MVCCDRSSISFKLRGVILVFPVSGGYRKSDEELVTLEREAASPRVASGGDNGQEEQSNAGKNKKNKVLPRRNHYNTSIRIPTRQHFFPDA